MQHSVEGKQGDQIARIFAYRAVVVCFCIVLITEIAQIFSYSMAKAM
jgi:hypothetical protein